MQIEYDTSFPQCLSSHSKRIETISLSQHTECSSCLTSITEPSLKVHLTTSVSSLAFLTYSEALRADQNLEKSWILIRCQTWERGARMTADSLTEVEVGMADMVKDVCDLFRGSVGYVLLVLEERRWIAVYFVRAFGCCCWICAELAPRLLPLHLARG
jgi:hypothetical protein